MKYKTVLLYISLLSFLCSTVMAIELDPNKFMTVDQIKPGMKGIGKTVFSGTNIEEFQIEVIGIDRNVILPKSDIIWVLCSGGPIDEAGVISGMSGSPVYIDGKLIGAIAYRAGSFAKRPIAGVTPIAEMLSIVEKSEKEESIGQTNLPDFDLPFFAKEETENEQSNLQDSDFLSIKPIQMPITMGGFSQKTIEYASPMLKRLNMIPIQGGGASAYENDKDVKVEPGSVAVIEFVKGDYSAFGSGTITYIDDNKILAFGHPLSGYGKIDLPVSVGRISLLIPSMLASTKQGLPIKTIGTLIQDDQYGILVDANKQPNFIPMKIRIKSTNGIQEYNFEVVKSRLFSSSYIYLTALDTITNATKSAGDYTIKSHSEVSIKGYPKLVKDNVFSGTDPSVVATQFTMPIFQIIRNKFEEVDIENITLDITFEEKQTSATIDDVRINKTTVKPGDSVTLTISITPYLQETITKQVEVTIPKDTPEGRALLRISDASASSSWDRTRAPMKSKVTDLGQIIKQIQEEESNNNIIIDLFYPKAGATVRGEELPALPLTALNIISSTKQVGTSGPTAGTIFLRQKVQTDYVISGSANLQIVIDREAP
ncbi:MAG: SpoIVB peptidase S55 domain-containing protein [Candidatus Poribacteria bacterium]